MSKQWIKIKEAVSNICLVDQVLMLFMAVLLVSMAFHLFGGAAASEETSSIDMIIRTSASAIFGYFISGNFLQADSSQQPAKTVEPSAEPSSVPVICCSRLQITVVSTIGLISLFLLLIAKNRAALTPEFTATVSQLRDFVAACIGYLISCGKKR